MSETPFSGSVDDPSTLTGLSDGKTSVGNAPMARKRLMRRKRLSDSWINTNLLDHSS